MSWVNDEPVENQRSRATDFIGMAKNIVDSYPRGLAHGTQKDAIQNGWDAVSNRSYTRNYISQNWSFKFILSKDANGDDILQMIDEGTVGLTGDLTSDQITPNEELPEEERWARWESLAFKKSTRTDMLGARGQGKMIFMYASSDHAIMYDSLREDGTYRFGFTKLTTSDSPVWSFNEDEGREMIKAKSGLEPLNIQGSRVIIYKPKEEIIRSLRDGTFMEAIEETWWPNILKYGARISVIIDGNVNVALVPDVYKELAGKPEDSEGRHYWFDENIEIKFKGEIYRIKKVYFGHNPRITLPEHLMGASYFRSGMQIGKIDFNPTRLRVNTFGFIEFDEKLDEKLHEIEESHHYGFKSYGEDSVLWNKIKAEIESQIEQFGYKKLGAGIDPRQKESRKRNEAEREALNFLNDFTKGWNLLGTTNKPGGTRPPGPGPGTSPLKLIGVALHDFIFPDTSIPRLDFGDVIKDFYISIFNKTKGSFEVGYKIIILQGDTVIKTIDEAVVKLSPNSDVSTHKKVLEITESAFEPGKYKLKVLLYDNTSDKKERLDEISRTFWVEEEPSFRSPFDVQGLDFSEAFSGHPDKDIYVDREWYLQPKGSEVYVLYYNIDHPSYKRSLKDKNGTTRFISEISTMAAIELLLKKAENSNEDEAEYGPFDKDAFVTGSNTQRFVELSRVISKMHKALDG